MSFPKSSEPREVGDARELPISRGRQQQGEEPSLASAAAGELGPVSGGGEAGSPSPEEKANPSPGITLFNNSHSRQMTVLLLLAAPPQPTHRCWATTFPRAKHGAEPTQGASPSASPRPSRWSW